MKIKYYISLVIITSPLYCQSPLQLASNATNFLLTSSITVGLPSLLNNEANIYKWQPADTLLGICKNNKTKIALYGASSAIAIASWSYQVNTYEDLPKGFLFYPLFMLGGLKVSKPCISAIKDTLLSGLKMFKSSVEEIKSISSSPSALAKLPLSGDCKVKCLTAINLAQKYTGRHLLSANLIPVSTITIPFKKEPQYLDDNQNVEHIRPDYTQEEEQPRKRRALPHSIRVSEEHPEENNNLFFNVLHSYATLSAVLACKYFIHDTRQLKILEKTLSNMYKF